MSHPVIISSSSFPLIHEIGLMGDKNGIEKHPDRVMPKLNVFVYVIKGQLQVIEDNEVYNLKEGSYLFLRKNIHHWGKDFYQPGSQWFYIHFFNHDIQENINEYSTYGKTSLIHHEEYQRKLTMPKYGEVSHLGYTQSQLEQILEMFESSHPMRPLLTSVHTYQFFLALYLENLETYANMKSNRMITKMIQLIDKQERHKLSSQEISKTLNMNYAYLSTLFKQHTGKSITQYQNERMVEKAIQLFRKENFNVSEVSDKLGFSNPFYFSRVFKKVTGMPPTDYLRQIYRG
ncbi:Helix-turn-helix domain-containing protein [Gracilibacillus orientalis]|uniref:Helix-turn-helix domain-containing protein n=1 Tax=Gracilibacillus orientalis TaxID=334253 RepID=A0A1I4QUN9_9BACI|nr:helix-turn-helix domain-containing protein [Gracilibacillus orientalis]SFM43721.1 Helix-turn-helix domain-containing protein [Gracilibacillus orientalis]